VGKRARQGVCGKTVIAEEGEEEGEGERQGERE